MFKHFYKPVSNKNIDIYQTINILKKTAVQGLDKINDRDIKMEHLQQLLKDLENISLADISAIPDDNQPAIVIHIEQLQDELKNAFRKQNEQSN